MFEKGMQKRNLRSDRRKLKMDTLSCCSDKGKADDEEVECNDCKRSFHLRCAGYPLPKSQYKGEELKCLICKEKGNKGSPCLEQLFQTLMEKMEMGRKEDKEEQERIRNEQERIRREDKEEQERIRNEQE